jgi:phosphoribosyl 1,2-cyclic phosphodiesterase
MIDYGIDWYNKFSSIHPTPCGILVTHAHPDHAGGLKQKINCPVYALKEHFNLMKNYPILQKKIIKADHPFTIGSITIQAFPVEHSINTPTVGYKITAGKKSIFYVPDLVFIKQQHAALKDVDLYIGDGARILYPLVRKQGAHYIGHTTIFKQLSWCKQEKISLAIFTHCGSEIVKKQSQAKNKISDLSRQFGVKAKIAYDGMVVRI